MRFDFNSIYEQEFPIYIHSNNFTFKMAFQDVDFQGFLDELTNNLIRTLKKDIEFFENIEQTIVDNQLAEYKALKLKPKFTDRDSYLKFLKDYKTATEEKSSGDNGLYAIVNFKRKQETAKDRQDSAKDAIDDLYMKAKGQKKDKKNKQTKTLNEILSDPDLSPETKREINKILNETDQELDSLFEELGEYISILLTSLFKVYDPTSIIGPDTGIETSAAKVQARLKPIVKRLDVFEPGVGGQWRPKSAEELKNDFFAQAEKMGPFVFLGSLREKSGVTDFFGSIIDGQLNTPLGEVYELFQANAIVDLIEKDIAANIYPVFDKEKVIITSKIKGVDKSNTIDLAFDSFEKLGIKTVFGASLKLIASDSLIKVDAGPKPLWESFMRFIGKREVFKYSYLRQNLFALSEFYADDESSKINFDLNLLADFEKKIFAILSTWRLFLGLYETLDNQQKRSVGTVDLGNNLYFAAYLWEEDNIYRTTDILRVIIKDLEEQKQFYATSKKDPQIITLGAGRFPNPNKIDISKERVEKLYEHKKLAIQRLVSMNKKISYKEFLKDGDILKMLNELNNTIGKHGYEGKPILSITTTPRQLAQFFPKDKK